MQDVPDKLIAAYLEGGLDEAQAEALSEWVLASKANAQYLASLTALEQGLVKHSKLQSNRDILAELQAEGIAEAIEPDESAPSLYPLDTNALTRQKYASAMSYVLRHTFTPMRVATIATAAVVLLGFVLLIVLMSGGADDSEQIVDIPTIPEQQGPTDPFVNTQQVVATLTGEQDAAWERRPGEDLYAGQRFTLTQGIAEITTLLGAVALIEAPVTIELIDNDNAIRLHTGKLLGVCRTPSSKGFSVGTHDAEIVDVGTVFAVSTAPGQGTVTEVIEGEVDLRSVRSDRPASDPIRLSSGQSASIDGVGRVVIGPVKDSGAFDKLASFMSGVREFSGHIRLLQYSQFKTYLRSDDAYLIPDLLEHRLTRDLEVTLNRPGEYVRFSGLETTGTVPAGTTIHSYVVRFMPSGQREKTPDGSVVAEGQVTFNGNVLGVVTNDQRADQFAQAIGPLADQLYDTQQRLRWPDDNLAHGSDWIELMEDGRTLAFTFTAHHADEVRVIVEAPARGDTQP